VVVAEDPEAWSAHGAAETGIVVAGHGSDGQLYVLADCSMRGTPDQRGRATVTAYHTWSADRLCGEVNNGGEMVGHVIRTIDPTVSSL
jgi:phage terminase large subunit-like protein